MPNRKDVVFDVKFQAHGRGEIVKHLVLEAIRLRESDNTAHMLVRSYQTRTKFSIDLSAIEWVRVGGKIRKLRSPAGQNRIREAELKFLLLGKREGLSDPALKSYENDELVSASSSGLNIFGYLLGAIGFVFLSLPGLAMLAVLALIGFVIMKMMQHVH